MTSNTVLILNEFKKGLISFFDELIEQFPENYINFQFQFTSIWNKYASNKS